MLCRSLARSSKAPLLKASTCASPSTSVSLSALARSCSSYPSRQSMSTQPTPPPTSSAPNRPPLVMQLIFPSDLVQPSVSPPASSSDSSMISQPWPRGPLIAQGSHATMLLLSTYLSTSSALQEYISPENVTQMHKVVLQTPPLLPSSSTPPPASLSVDSQGGQGGQDHHQNKDKPRAKGKGKGKGKGKIVTLESIADQLTEARRAWENRQGKQPREEADDEEEEEEEEEEEFPRFVTWIEQPEGIATCIAIEPNRRPAALKKILNRCTLLKD